jgi:hypothetical protein
MEDLNDKSLYRSGLRHSPLYDVVREVFPLDPDTFFVRDAQEGIEAEIAA